PSEGPANALAEKADAGHVSVDSINQDGREQGHTAYEGKIGAAGVINIDAVDAEEVALLAE
ncbi:unnamed protein product, partial [Amoebophrya sp. A120]